jgi:hypothetical protein
MSIYDKFIKKYGKDPILPPPFEKVPEVKAKPLPPPPSIPDVEEEIVEIKPEADRATIMHGKGNNTLEQTKMENLLGKTPSEIEKLMIQKKSPEQLFEEFDKLLGRKPGEQAPDFGVIDLDLPKEASKADKLVKLCEAYNKLSKR